MLFRSIVLANVNDQDKEIIEKKYNKALEMKIDPSPKENKAEKDNENTELETEYDEEKVFMDSVINEYGKNKDFFGKILTDEEFKNNLMSMMMVEVYNELKSAP